MMTNVSIIRNHKLFKAYEGMLGFACPKGGYYNLLASLDKEGQLVQQRSNRIVEGCA